MSNLSDPEYVSKLLKAWPPIKRLLIHEGEYRAGFSFYMETCASVEPPHPIMKVAVDPPKPVPAKKPAAPRAKRLKNSAIRKDGVILLKDKEPEPSSE